MNLQNVRQLLKLYYINLNLHIGKLTYIYKISPLQIVTSKKYIVFSSLGLSLEHEQRQLQQTRQSADSQ